IVAGTPYCLISAALKMTQISLTPMGSPIFDSRYSFESVRIWKVDQVNSWLKENNFKEYEQLFCENDITGDVLLELDHQILKELNIVKIGDRVRILVAVKALLKSCINNIGRYPKENISPIFDRFPVQLTRSSSLPRNLTRTNSGRNGRSENSPREINSPRDQSPRLQHVKNPSVDTPNMAAYVSIKQHIIKVYDVYDGEEHESRSIDIREANDAKSILAKVLYKFNISDDEADKYSLCTKLNDDSYRSLTDDELVRICKNPDRPERDHLILRKDMSRQRKLEKFFGERYEKISAGPSHSKLQNFFGQRPPSELISLNLTEYFPGHNSEELERSARNSIRRASRISRPKSKRISRFFVDDATLPVPSPKELSEITITEEPDEASEVAEEDEDDEMPEDWSPDQDSEDEFDDDTDSENSVLKWIKGALIGSGSFGSVYLGLNAVTGELMAVKCVELPTGQSANEDRKKSMLDALQREIALLKDLHHENIVQYLGSQHDEKNLHIFLEYVPGGSVATMLNNYGPLEETLVRSFVRQILQGLNYLHEQEIIHRDIKGANILVDIKGGIKISDFGISKKVEDEFMAATSAHRPSLQGSVFWMAPEVVKQVHYSTKADIWSLGCLIVEMFTGDHPFPGFNQMQAMFKIGSSCSPEIPDNISPDAKEFLAKTFEPDHEHRPTANVLLTHAFAASSVKSSPQPSPMWHTLSLHLQEKIIATVMADDFELSFEDQFEDHSVHSAVDSDTTPSRSNSIKLKKGQGNTDSQRRKEKRRSKLWYEKNSQGQSDSEASTGTQETIPTAIVIKNIPFSIKRDALLAILNTLDIPKPYAFNYHFDNGVFRGLAFANYRTPEETDLVVSALNGYEVSGRKLRVEYKRVLPAAEREAKEREKAEKQKADNGGVNIKEPQLDLNDPETLKFYDQVIIFRDDKTREELVFSKTLTSAHRHTVHLIAQKLGLYHYSEGEGDERVLKIVRKPASAAINIKQTPSRNGSYGRRAATQLLASAGLSESPSNRSSRGDVSPLSRSPFRRSWVPDGIPIVFPIRQPRGPDPTQNFTFRPSRLNASAIPFGVVDDTETTSDYSEHRKSDLFDVHPPAFQSIAS
ncbi:284_t:CDS:10, partial [Ambispora leptoticha]